ncbi:MAG: tyrosine-type recombinase/integrase [Polyangiales bacterium]|nr:tyrosine-type recombinase/integrase [Sandaracinaceae bacterium]
MDAHLLAAPHADGYLARRRAEGVAVATVAKELGALRTALTFCARRDIYRGDPKWCLPPELRGAYVPQERALTLEEYRQLREALAPERRDYLAAFVGLGVRDSELYRITAADWVGGRVHIRGRKGRRDRADRWMTPPAEVAAVLDLRIAALDGAPGPVFPIWPNVRRDLHRGCARAGIPPVSPNDLRRTFASWLAERGVPELVTASLMGHSNSAMVRRVYARIGTTAQVDAVGLLPPLG